MKYSFFSSLGLVQCAGRKGYRNVSWLGRHHCARQSPISHSRSCGVGLTGARRELSSVAKAGISSASGGR